MKISVIGTGYVGLVTGTCFSEMGYNVCCVDSDQNKIENLKKGIIPIYEPGLEPLVKDNFKKGQLDFTTDIRYSLENCDVCFIAVGTPMDEDGSVDIKYVLNVAHEIGMYMSGDLVIVDKSTVPVGTADLVYSTIKEELEKRNISFNFDVVSNPEFLKEGNAIEDCMHPDRVVIGVPNNELGLFMKRLYSPFIRNRDRFIIMDVKSAEMTKYASNAMLATRISFMNELANICERVGADINNVRLGMGSDSRIGYSFLYAGCGYGGSCFPKDVQALIKTASDYEYEANILKNVEKVNFEQKKILAKKVISKFGENLSGLTFALWGLSFKPKTDDMREAPSIKIIDELTKRGANINAFDPKAGKEAQRIFKDNDRFKLFDDKYSVLKDTNALLLITEWKEFRCPDFDYMKKTMKNFIIFDGRNQYNFETAEKYGFEYYQIGNVR